jgi:hypothetical protein
MVLTAEHRSHLGVLGEQPEPDDAPVAAGAGELVRVDREVRAMEAADADVDDARFEASTVIGGHRDPALRDLGEVGFTEADRKRSTHDAHI